MLRKLLNKLEDPRRPLLAPTLKLCESFGVLYTSNLFMTKIYISMQILLLIIIFGQTIGIWFLKDDTNVLLGHVSYAALALVVGVKTAAMMVSQYTWRAVNDYVIASDIEQRKTADPTNLAIIRKNTKYCRIITFGYFTNAVVGCTPTLVLEPLKYFLKRGTEREKVGRPLPLWVPFDSNGPAGWLCNYVLMVFWLVYGTMWLCACDTHIITVMVAFKGELELLRRDSANIFGDEHEDVSDAEAKQRIKTCHTRFLLLTKHVELLNSVLSPVKFVHVMVCSFMICTLAFQFNILSGSEQLVMGNFLLYIVAQLFLFCWHSNEILVTSMELYLGPYESRWWSRRVPLRRSALLLAGQFRKTLVFTAGPFADLSLNTFVAIIKGAYSYYTLLSQSQVQ